jgi:hypothetical protein
VKRPLLAAVLCVAALPVAHATQYVGVEGFYSSDADNTDIDKTAIDLDFTHADTLHYAGVSLEDALFRPFGQPWIDDQRVYFRFADSKDAWNWNARIGSDGHTVLGSADLYNQATNRQEYFIERDIVETPIGLQRGLYSTYAGGAYDLPLGNRDTLTSVLGVDQFSGGNTRIQNRENFIHMLVPDWGLSVQLRLRDFNDSDPHQFDYFSPRWYAEAIPVVQIRRYVSGWRFALAAGVGEERANNTTWRDARLVQASVSSPVKGTAWTFTAAATYTNTPVNAASLYDYAQLSFSLGRSF